MSDNKLVLPGKGGIDIVGVVQNLAANDFYFETVLYGIVETLKSKLDKDGKPLITDEEIAAKAKEARERIVAESKIVKPQPQPKLIIPNDLKAQGK